MPDFCFCFLCDRTLSLRILNSVSYSSLLYYFIFIVFALINIVLRNTQKKNFPSKIVVLQIRRTAHTRICILFKIIRFQDDRHVSILLWICQKVHVLCFGAAINKRWFFSKWEREHEQNIVPGAVCVCISDVCCMSDDETFPNLINVCIVSSHCLTE